VSLAVENILCQEIRIWISLVRLHWPAVLSGSQGPELELLAGMVEVVVEAVDVET
jgi:hypothetical protein